ncbi:unnamed protein product [Paramecium sonneborni]|uniref:Uncharacterized protein n=1 Tax=Paramecium sonneborni TaxID=65129 RepID=A0A8S1QLB8_9CILI|nr:unnamed protein product [Paramecium sonneborni]
MSSMDSKQKAAVPTYQLNVEINSNQLPENEPQSNQLPENEPWSNQLPENEPQSNQLPENEPQSNKSSHNEPQSLNKKSQIDENDAAMNAKFDFNQGMLDNQDIPLLSELNYYENILIIQDCD